MKKLLALALVLTQNLHAVAAPNAQSGAQQPKTPPREQIKISDFAQELDRAGRLDPVIDVANRELKRLIPDADFRKQLQRELDKIRRDQSWSKLDHFPVVPIRIVTSLRPALGGLGSPNAGPVRTEKVSGALADYLGSICIEKAPTPAPVSPSLVGVTNGHFPDSSLDACLVHQSLRLTKLLNALNADNGSEVEFNSEKIQSVRELFAALLKSGHTIEMRNERTYANFISLNAGPRPIIWPVWLDTGLENADGTKIVIPMGHSQHAWRVRGPVLNANVTFFLGVDGVGFFAQVDERPAWTGLRAHYVVKSTDGNAPSILIAADIAHTYASRIRFEAAHYAQDMPADGYGYLGVCNDSTAVLEALTRMDPITQDRSLTTYPLMRSAELDAKAPRNDGLDKILRDLPKDGDEVYSRASTLYRILNMFPFDELDTPLLHDEDLRKQMGLIIQEVGLKK